MAGMPMSRKIGFLKNILKAKNILMSDHKSPQKKADLALHGCVIMCLFAEPRGFTT